MPRPMKAWNSAREYLDDPGVLPDGKAMMREAMADGHDRLVDRLLRAYTLLPTGRELVELTTDGIEGCADDSSRYSGH